MGQGYRAIILASKQPNEKELIRTWVDSGVYGNGYKLREHSYIGNKYVEAVEYLISPLGMFHKSRLVWAGDYADEEQGLSENLHTMSYADIIEQKMSSPNRYDMSAYRYIVNHTRKIYVDKNIETETMYHPLPLLTAEGNGRGGGDCTHSNCKMLSLVGTWARHTISVEIDIPEGYAQLMCEF